MKKEFRKCLAILMVLTFMFASASFSPPTDRYAYAETENTEPGITISETELYMTVANNPPQTLEAGLDYFAGSPTVRWTTSDRDIVNLSPETGSVVTIYAEKVGLATITAFVTDDEDGKEYTATCEVAVFGDRDPKITLDKPTLTLTEGDAEKLTPISPNIPLDVVVWSSSNEKAAKVDKDGNVTAAAAGTATITATAKVINREYTATCEVTVDAAAPDPGGEPDVTPAVSGTLLAKMTAKGKNSLVLTWSKVKGAEGYDIFFIKCGKDAPKKVKTIKGNKTFKWTKSNLKAKNPYKACVKAYIIKGGKKTYVKTSPVVHAYTSGGTASFTNPKSVTVNKESVSIKAGKTYMIKANVTKLQKGKKLMPGNHGAKLRYASSNKKIATVSNTGKITAKSKGSCKVYVIAINGARKAVTVTVK